MIDPTRRTLLALIEELGAACPEYRLGQMILNLAFLKGEAGDQALWDMEDAELIEAARKHRTMRPDDLATRPRLVLELPRV